MSVSLKDALIYESPLPNPLDSARVGSNHISLEKLFWNFLVKLKNKTNQRNGMPCLQLLITWFCFYIALKD